MEDVIYSSIIKSLTKASWWKYVQPEVEKKLQFITDNIKTIGPSFKDAFIASFKFHHARRVIQGTSVNSDMPSALFGRTVTEECYQSGINGTKSLLQLDDWTRPNNADVQACMHICQQIEYLQQLGFFDQTEANKPNEENKTLKGLFSDIIEWPLGKKKK